MAELPAGITGSVDLPKTQTSLTNCWNAEGTIINRPGITQLNTTGQVARGQFVWNESLYQVVSTNLIKITDVTTGAFSTIGTISGVEDIVVATDFVHAVIIVKGGNGYTLNFNDLLTQITDPDFLPSDSVASMNGRFIYIPSDGSPAFFSDTGNGASIQSTSSFEAEKLPDKNSVVINLNEILYIGGTDSFELFRDVNLTPLLPYSRLAGRVSYGYIGGLIEHPNTFLFVGREKDQDVGIYAIDQGTAVKVSNERIDDILISYSVTDLKNIKSNRLKWKGYDISTFKLPNDSFGFYKGSWFFLTTDQGVWEADYITHFDLKYYVSHQDKIGVFGEVFKDYGKTFEMSIQGSFEEENDFSVGALKLNISQGFNPSGSVGLDLSDNNVLYGPRFYKTTGDIGEYSNQLTWEYPGGLGYYYGYMGYRLTTTGINFSASQLSIR